MMQSSNNPTPLVVRYRASFPFTPNAPGQLSFAAGDVLLVQQEAKQGEWILAAAGGGSGNVGWVPLSYLVPEHQQQMGALPNMGVPMQWDRHDKNNKNPFDDTLNEDDDFGFEGPIMGGSAAPVVVVNDEETNTAPKQNQKTSRLGGRIRIGKGLKNMGSRMRQASQKASSSIAAGAKTAGSSISSGTKKVTSSVRDASKETKYRIDDMMQQRSGGAAAPPPCQQRSGGGATAPPPCQQQQQQQPARKRTQGEQMQINAANGAARGALVGGTVGLVLSGGNVSHAVNRAKVHGVYGGAYGAASGWKPFGN